MLSRGTEIAGYRIERMLGAGGMGVVYEATQIALGRTVALKVITAGRDADPVFLKRFRREGQAQGALDHPHIVPVHEAGETDLGLFLAMRLVRGPTLKDMIVSRELDPGRALRILTGVADALDSAHAAGMVHRDVKPQNILVGSLDHPYLADFGLTQAAGATSLTDTGVFVGTFDYISPEQIQGDTASPASDVYALAGVLYECMTGVVPYPKRSRAAVIYAHLAATPPRVTDQRPELPQALDDVVERGLAKDPAARPASAQALIEQAREAFDRRTRAAITPPGPIDSPEEAGIQRPEAEVTTDRGRERVVASTAAAVTGAMSRTGTQATGLESSEEPTAAAAPERPGTKHRRRGRPRAGTAAIGGGVVTAMLAAGALVGGAGGGGGSRAERLPNTTSTAEFELGFGDSWRRTADAPDVPGLDGGQSIALTSARGGGGLVATTTDATGPALLPSALLRALPEKPTATPVQLGDVQALHYRALRPRGVPAPMDVYAVPTDEGVATIACHGTAPATRDACGRVAATLTLLGPEPFDVGPDSEYAEALGAALAPLGRAVRAGSRRLRAAREPRDQAAAAVSLEGSYGQAAARIRRLRPSPAVADVNRRLAEALRATSDAYGDLAAAARRSSRARYRSAAAAVERRERKVAGVLRELRDLGYESAA